MQLIVEPSGTIRTIYDETLELASFGQVTIQRGSHVEPNLRGEWFADLSPLAGPQLGPFPLRSAALAAEHQWLERHWLDQP